MIAMNATTAGGLEPRRCPDRPASKKALGFTPKPMVRWLDPRGLANTRAAMALSGIFGRYADKREMQAVLQARMVADFSEADELWLDYVADTGDGFDSTHAIAHLLAAEELTVARGDESHRTEPGRVLIFGGDQVYPTASEASYHERFIGPLTAALPCAPADRPRTMFLIPGNHDWYDGLVSFLRLFCQQQWVGGWRTQQSRSYFAAKLPHNWWVWGIDVQFDWHIDEPQLRHFKDVAARDDVGPATNLILCTAKPSWVREGLNGDDIYKDPAARRNLEFFERRILAPHGLRPVITLAGDLHHYARYETRASDDDPPRQKITSGGGGAFLYPTHTLPAEVHWPRHEADGEVTVERYERKKAYPDRATSKRLRRGTLLAPFVNRRFGGLVGAVYLLVAWAVLLSLRGASPAEALGEAALFWDLPAALLSPVHNPVSLLLAIVLVLALVGFADADRWWLKLTLGAGHAVVHLVAVLVLMWLLATVSAELPTTGFAVLFVVVLGGVGAAVGSLAMGVYLYGAHRWLRVHANEAFSAQHIPDYKNFLRLRIGPGGTLTIFPIGLERVPRDWALQPHGDDQDPWFTPAQPITAHLIESPIDVKPRTPQR